MAEKVKVVDKGWNRLVTLAKKYSGSGKAASVGIQGPDASEPKKESPKVTNVLVATVHEFGSPRRNIPQRSFIGATYDKNAKVYDKELQRIGAMMAEGHDIDGELQVLGDLYRGDIIMRINSDIPPKTQRQEAGDPEPALIRTNQLRDSITAIVVDLDKIKG